MEAMDIDEKESMLGDVAGKLKELEQGMGDKEKISNLRALIDSFKEVDGDAISLQLTAIEQSCLMMAELLAVHSPDELPEFMETLSTIFSSVSNAKSSRVLTKVLKKLARPESPWGLSVTVNVCQKNGRAV